MPFSYCSLKPSLEATPKPLNVGTGAEAAQTGGPVTVSSKPTAGQRLRRTELQARGVSFSAVSLREERSLSEGFDALSIAPGW